MNKLVIAAGIAAVGAGGYLYTQQQASQSVSVLDQIPSDSAFVSAQLTPLELDKFLGSMSSVPSMDELLELSETDRQQMTNRETFFITLGDTYFEAIQTGEAYKAAFGAPDTIKSYVYLVGLAPVFKFDVTNEQAFWATFDKIEKDSDFKHVAKKVGDIAYRSYSMVEENNEIKLEFIVAVHQGIATITLDSPDFGETSPLKLALGVEAPAQSVAQADIINKMLATHPELGKDSVGYLDHQQFATGFTTTDGNLLAKHVAKINALIKTEDPSSENPFAAIQSEQCKTEIAGIAANWPRTVFGATLNENSTMDLDMLVESNNSVVLEALKSIRGFIPALSSMQNSALSLGLGIDVNKLAPALNTIWQDSLAIQYTCAPLAEMQAGLRQANPAMIGMAAGFVNGLKGVSLNLFDYGFGEGEYGEELNMLDASVSISADSPIALFQAAQMMDPSLSQIQIPEDGTPVEVPPQLTQQFADIGTVYVASKGNHLSFYTGESATKAITNLFGQALESNGLYNTYINYSKLFNPFVEMMKRSDEAVPAELEPFIQDGVEASMTFDVTDKGLAFDMNNIRY
ncbi:hypothetical protein HC752_06485 [Vibrio sp. S9_S30]|uniref:hypothetical protein n=1 Tax=Vibrio sp. S9_S30 TaxID=2720226 RepID=UPI001681A9B1|nr:hypothetical protein [Vibrio sp. S9_S30]MBD1556579.1 hypothetical protein [Vibrio sp. S9_S30]